MQKYIAVILGLAWSQVCCIGLFSSALYLSFLGCKADGEAFGLIDNGTEQVVPDSGGEDVLNTRSFFMGMTNWPYAGTLAAVQNTQALVEAHTDVYGVWLDNGVPWSAALSDVAYPQTVLTKLDELSREFPANHQRYVSVGLLDVSRSTLATDWDGAARTGSFHEVGLGDAIVYTAYLNWLTLVIERVRPDWLNFAVEFSDLAHNSPESWSDGAQLLCSIYAELKSRYPELNLFFSVALKHPDSSLTGVLETVLPDVELCTDFAAASTYGFVFYGHLNAGDPENLPENWLSQITDLIPNKPVVVAETGWIAESLMVDMWNIAVEGTADFQRRYMELLLSESTALQAELVTWWCIVDFDSLWATRLDSDPLASIWRDTGLYDAELNPRPALEVWDSWLALPRLRLTED